MRIRNLHERAVPAGSPQAGALIDGLASPDDRLWPHGDWPAMRLDRPLAVGADGGHGPIRYSVEAYERGRLVRFRFKAPRGLQGHHSFELVSRNGGEMVLQHVVEGHATGWMVLGWPLVFRPLHHALIEDAVDHAERAGGREPVRPARWSTRVRLLRWLLARRSSRRGPE